jgi:hypothetical protein
MNKIIFIFILVFSSPMVLACANLKDKPSYFTHEKIDCGLIVNKIIHPKVIIGGQTYPLAIDLTDKWGVCPDKDVGCYRPHYNILARGNAICKAFGLGKYAKSKSYSPLFHTTPDVMARLRRINPTSFTPGLVRINHSRSEFFEVREIWCHKVYKKR